MKENKGIQVISLANYKPVEISESLNRAKGWINYGVDNNFMNYVIDRYNKSTTNGTLIDGISKAIYGKGLSAKNANTKPNEYAQMISLLKKKDVRKLTFDLKLQGMCAMQCIWNKTHDKIVEVSHLPVETLRAEEVNEDGDIEGYYYSTDWTSARGKHKPERLSALNKSRDGLEVLFVKPYRPGNLYYCPPDYSQCLPYAEAEQDIAVYHINNIQNGFSSKTILNFNNGQATTDEAKADIANKVDKKFGGASGNPIMLSFNDTAEQATTFDTFQIPDIHEHYSYISTEAKEMIRFAHKAQPLLFGMSTNNGFASNADEIKMQAIFMDNQVIKPFQELLLDAFDEILSVNGISLDLYFKTNQPWKSDEEENNEETNTEE